jgi:hypothetical protein
VGEAFVRSSGCATYVGIGPKAVLLRYRLQEAAATLDAGEVDDPAELASSFGWHDLPHFNRTSKPWSAPPPPPTSPKLDVLPGRAGSALIHR